MDKVFTSPQTDSKYTVVAEFPKYLILVAFRPLGGDRYRIRIQGAKELLELIRLHLRGWSQIKDDDHISIVVCDDELRVAIAEALHAVGDIVAYVLLNRKVVDEVLKEEDEGEYNYDAEY